MEILEETSSVFYYKKINTKIIQNRVSISFIL